MCIETTQFMRHSILSFLNALSLRILVIVFYWVFSSANIWGQYFERIKTCSPDTIKIELFKNNHEERSRYRAVECIEPTNLGLRFEAGFSGYSYSGNSNDWFENKITPSGGIALAYRNLSIGTRLKFTTFNPGVEYYFGNELLRVNSRVISKKSDFYLGYSLNARNLVSFEPYLSYSIDIFRVKNQASLGQSFNLLTAKGLLGGLSVNRYISIGGYEFFSVFLNFAYSMVDYTRTHAQLNKGYIEGTIGIAYKGFYERQFREKVE